MSDTLTLAQVGRVVAFTTALEDLERLHGVRLTTPFRVDLRVDGYLAGSLRRADAAEGYSLQTSVVR